MFKDYDKIAQYIDSVKNNIGTETDINQIINNLNYTYGLQLESSDFTNLISSITELKSAEKILKNTNSSAWNSKSGVDFSTDISKAQERVISADKRVNYEANNLITKSCIKSYNGPLTMEIMKQLEDAKYDATYGSESMKQMYLMYQENIRVRADNEQCRQELNTCYQKINGQYSEIVSLTNENRNLNIANNELKQDNKNLTNKITELTQQISSLSEIVKMLPKLIITQLSEVFGKKQTNTDTSKDKPLMGAKLDFTDKSFEGVDISETDFRSAEDVKKTL